MTKTEYIPNPTSSFSDRTIDLKNLYQRLANLGFPRKFVREVILPDWWCDEFEQEKGAVVEAAAYVSQRTGIDFRTLLDADREPEFQEDRQPCYKLRQGTTKNSLAAARSMAERVGAVIAYACKPPLVSIEKIDPQVVRSQILANFKFVNLESLLDFCWQHGIPVVHTNNFPKEKGQKKFDGMVGKYGDCPVIVISKNQKSPAWLAFILAHELGHIICGHIKGSSLIDEKIDHDQLGDIEEQEADQFAMEILFGRKNAIYKNQTNLDLKSLKSYVKACSVQDHVDPALVILNYAWFKATSADTNKAKGDVWKVANVLLSNFEESEITAPQLINYQLGKHLDWENLSNDNQEFLERMTKVEGASFGGY
jgi:Zn-dependent peptidase ImmA (M78 family)